MQTAKAIKSDLEQIAEIHLRPDPAQEVDAFCQELDRDKMLPWLKGPRVLEMGCGDGVWTKATLTQFGRAEIVDASASLLAAAKATHGTNVSCHESFFENFVPPGALYDTVLATHILEHVDDPVRVLTQARTWLKPGGHLLVIVPNATSLHRRIGVRLGLLKTPYELSERDHVVGHQRVYDLPQLRSDVVRAGFDILYERGLLVKVLSNKQMAEHSRELVRALVDVSDEVPIELTANLALVASPTSDGL